MTVAQLVLVLATVSITGIAQILLKIATSSQLHAAHTESNLNFYLEVFSTKSFWAGLLLYGLSVLLWLKVLSKVELSVAYPFVGVSFALTFLFGVFWFGEVASTAKLLGTLLVFAGCVLISQAA